VDNITVTSLKRDQISTLNLELQQCQIYHGSLFWANKNPR